MKRGREGGRMNGGRAKKEGSRNEQRAESLARGRHETEIKEGKGMDSGNVCQCVHV